MISPKNWKIVESRVRGVSHLKTGIECQDSKSSKIIQDNSQNEVLILAVSDGAGSASNSAIGSNLTCSSIISMVENFISNGGSVKDITRPLASLWVKNVREKIKKQASKDGLPERSYACTMLVAVVGSDCFAALQIGDGCIVYPENKGWVYACWPQHGEFINTTNFVTGTNAEDDLFFKLYEKTIDEIAVFTDGLEMLLVNHSNKSIVSSFFERNFVPVRNISTIDAGELLSLKLDSFLSSPIITSRTDDDITLMLASRLSGLV